MEYTLQNERLSVRVRALGAELQSVRGLGSGHEYLWQGLPEYWADRAPTLFPYIGRLTGGACAFGGRRYEMPIHGLAPYAEFALLRQEPSSLCLELAHSSETLTQYPFRFSFRVTYTLRGSALEALYTVENRDDKRMYFAVGGHPGIRVPMDDGTAFEDWRLCFTAPEAPVRVGFTPDCFVSGVDAPFPLEGGTDLPLRHDLFDDDAIVLRDMAREVTLEPVCGGRSVTVSYPDMPYLGIWHWPKTDAPYVCIEPWSSLPAKQGEVAVFEKQEDLICLEAGETYRNTWTIRI
jgi:galactose mutarotase-like enzyme